MRLPHTHQHCSLLPPRALQATPACRRVGRARRLSTGKRRVQRSVCSAPPGQQEDAPACLGRHAAQLQPWRRAAAHHHVPPAPLYRHRTRRRRSIPAQPPAASCAAAAAGVVVTPCQLQAETLQHYQHPPPGVRAAARSICHRVHTEQTVQTPAPGLAARCTQRTATWSSPPSPWPSTS
jgi:hypothetical protein